MTDTSNTPLLSDSWTEKNTETYNSSVKSLFFANENSLVLKTPSHLEPQGVLAFAIINKSNYAAFVDILREILNRYIKAKRKLYSSKAPESFNPLSQQTLKREVKKIERTIPDRYKYIFQIKSVVSLQTLYKDFHTQLRYDNNVQLEGFCGNTEAAPRIFFCLCILSIIGCEVGASIWANKVAHNDSDMKFLILAEGVGVVFGSSTVLCLCLCLLSYCFQHRSERLNTPSENKIMKHVKKYISLLQAVNLIQRIECDLLKEEYIPGNASNNEAKHSTESVEHKHDDASIDMLI